MLTNAVLLAAVVVGAMAAASAGAQDGAARTEQLIAASWELKAKLRSDPHRPRYHFLPPAGWMNDINGAIYWKGRYHVFYQCNPEGGYWKWMQWGHASSVDLVHWVHHPIALTPTPGGPDRDGCFSGGAFVSREGVPTFIYHGVPDGTCLATSTDDLLIHWTKDPGNPVIRVPRAGEPGFGAYSVFDPCAWWQDGHYYAVEANTPFATPQFGFNWSKEYRDPLGRVLGPAELGDTLYLFRSDDLVHWSYVAPFYRANPRATEDDEDCAVPDFFPLGSKHMLLFASHLAGTQYYLGRLEGERFVPEVHGRMNWQGGLLAGARTLLDAKGRRVYFDWIGEHRGVDWERESGWSGVMTLPRILSLSKGGDLRIEPAPELNALRYNHRRMNDVRADAGEVLLEGVRGDGLELDLTIDPGSALRCGVVVRRSPGGEERTEVVYDRAAGTLAVVFAKSGSDPRVKYPAYRFEGVLARLPEDRRYPGAQVAPLKLAPRELLKLRVYVDRSVLEVYANGRQCITQRIYPVRPDSLGVAFFAEGGGARLRTVDAWDMGPTNSE